MTKNAIEHCRIPTMPRKSDVRASIAVNAENIRLKKEVDELRTKLCSAQVDRREPPAMEFTFGTVGIVAAEAGHEGAVTITLFDSFHGEPDNFATMRISGFEAYLMAQAFAQIAKSRGFECGIGP